MIIDHTDPKWQLRYQKHKRENGAATYSREIVKHQIPVLERLLSAKGFDLDKVVISTCPLISDLDGMNLAHKPDLVVQYLHSYSYDEPFKQIELVAEACKRAKNLVFFTAYNSFAHLLRQHGYNAVFVPMTIEGKNVRRFKSKTKFKSKRIIYFGNLLHGKQEVYPIVKRLLEAKGWRVDTIESGKYNGVKLADQNAAWSIIGQYKYGIGVGRCALEMYELGLKVLVCGGQFAGLVMNEGDFTTQLNTNFNGRVVTFDRDPNTCIDCLDQSQVFVSDTLETLPLIEKNIAEYLKGVSWT